MKNLRQKKLNKSTKYYIICGGIAVVIILALLLIYAFVTKINILEWLCSKYAFLIYGAILIYVTIGIILFIKDKIRNL